MFKAIKNWWNRDKIQLANLEQLINNIGAKADSALFENKVLTEEAAVQAERQSNASKKGSDQPWVDVHSADFDPARGVQVELDWNSAFITYLKENGIKGKTEELIIQKWLALLYDDLVTKLEEESVEESVAQVKQDSDFQ